MAEEKRAHDVLWWRDENGNPQETSRANGEELGWKPMSKADFEKTFPETGDEADNE